MLLAALNEAEPSGWLVVGAALSVVAAILGLVAILKIRNTQRAGAFGLVAAGLAGVGAALGFADLAADAGILLLLLIAVFGLAGYLAATKLSGYIPRSGAEQTEENNDEPGANDQQRRDQG